MDLLAALMPGLQLRVGVFCLLGVPLVQDGVMWDLEGV